MIATTYKLEESFKPNPEPWDGITVMVTGYGTDKQPKHWRVFEGRKHLKTNGEWVTRSKRGDVFFGEEYRFTNLALAVATARESFYRMHYEEVINTNQPAIERRKLA